MGSRAGEREIILVCLGRRSRIGKTARASRHLSQVKVFTKLPTTITSKADELTPVSKTDLLTVAESARYLHVAEKTIRDALKDGRLAYVRDRMPGPWPKDGRYQMTRADLDAFKAKRSCVPWT